jgi:hypothetical protein
MAAYAQTERAFAGVFQFTDRNGFGTLTITPLAGDSSPNGVQRVQVTLLQGGQTSDGVGAYYAPGAGTATSPPPALLSFALIDFSGRSFYFQARVTAEGEGLVGEGTYFLVAEPQTEFSWSIESQASDSAPESEGIVSSQPALQGEWERITLAEAIGGVYFSAENQAAAPVNTATWTGGLPAAGQYRVEAFIPAPQEGAAPRTENATYLVSGGLTDTQRVRGVSQNVTTSQWLDLGTFTLGTSYEIVLTDETGEPAFTRSVVANALRFTPAAAGI